MPAAAFLIDKKSSTQKLNIQRPTRNSSSQWTIFSPTTFAKYGSSLFSVSLIHSPTKINPFHLVTPILPNTAALVAQRGPVPCPAPSGTNNGLNVAECATRPSIFLAPNSRARAVLITITISSRASNGNLKVQSATPRKGAWCWETMTSAEVDGGTEDATGQ